MPPNRLRSALSLSRTFTSTAFRSRDIPLPVIPICPPSTCACAPTPDLNIERDRPLANTAAPYAQHVLITTGQSDWTSRIEDEAATSAWGQFSADLRRELARPGGSAFDPQQPIMITASSFDPPVTQAEPPDFQPSDPLKSWVSGSATSLLLFPSFRHYKYIDLAHPASLPRALHAIQTAVPRPRVPVALPGSPSGTLPYMPIGTPTVLVCSHHSRDARCGVLGPLLQREFGDQLGRLGMAANTAGFLARPTNAPFVNVGCISHVGGHAWAGNVIVYLPRNTPHELAGTGVWYGRVEPKHVEGIIRETILGGRIIEELWRGGIGKDGMPMYIGARQDIRGRVRGGAVTSSGLG